MPAPRKSRDSGLDALREAVERTFAATAESAADTRSRVQELLDEVARRGQEASAEIGHRVAGAAQDLRFVRGDDLKSLNARLGRIERRLASLEKAVKPKAPARKRKAPTKK